jgi:hypothetical protein
MSTSTNSQEVAKTSFNDSPKELRIIIWKLGFQAPRKIAIGRTIRFAPGQALDQRSCYQPRLLEDYSLILQPQYVLRAIAVNYESYEVTLPFLQSLRPIVEFPNEQSLLRSRYPYERPPLPTRVVNNGYFDPGQDTIVLKEGFLSKNALLDREECDLVFYTYTYS